MKKAFSFILFLALAIFCNQAAIVHAAAPGFAVQPIQASNQIDKQAQFYNLLVTPNQSGKIQLKISNYTNGTHRYHVALNRALTNGSGQLDYTQHGLKVPSGVDVNIEQLFAKPKDVSIAPRSEQTVTLDYTAPSTAISGMLLGAVRVTCLDANVGSTTASSQIAYAITVQLQNTPTIPHFTPALKMTKASAKATASGALVYAHLVNPLPVIQSKMTVKATLRQVGHKKVLMHNTISAARLAPAANFKMPLSTLPKDLKSGDYTVTVDAELPDNAGKWHFVKQVHISQAVIKTAPADKTPAQELKQLPWWIYAILAVILVGLSGTIVWLLRQKGSGNR